MLDTDLAQLYGVTTGNLNKAVQRNINRFPSDFMFQLTDEEESALGCQTGILNAGTANLRFQSGRASSHGGRRTHPYAFTEQGVAMLSSVLRSERAVEVNIAIMRTFVQLRRLMDSNALLAEKIEALEEKYADHDQQFLLVFEAIKQLIAARACPGIAKRRRTSSQRTRLSHQPIRHIREKITRARENLIVDRGRDDAVVPDLSIPNLQSPTPHFLSPAASQSSNFPAVI